MLTFLLFLSTLFVAYANGGNDNFKGVATLFGSGVATYKTAISIATLTTFAGSIASLLLAGTLIKAFSGHGLVPDMIASSPHFLISVAVGAGSAVILATVTGFPISTTHSLTGGLVGAGFSAVGSGLNLSYLGAGVLVPLLVSPILAVGLTIPVYTLLHRLRVRAKLSEDACVCLGQENVTLGDGTVAIAAAHRSVLTIGQAETCRTSYAGAFLGISLQKLVDSGHYLSACAVSFARGLNDTPKIAALLFAAQALDLRFGVLAIALAMAVWGHHQCAQGRADHELQDCPNERRSGVYRKYCHGNARDLCKPARSTCLHNPCLGGRNLGHWNCEWIGP